MEQSEPGRFPESLWIKAATAIGDRQVDISAETPDPEAGLIDACVLDYVKQEFLRRFVEEAFESIRLRADSLRCAKPRRWWSLASILGVDQGHDRRFYMLRQLLPNCYDPGKIRVVNGTWRIVCVGFCAALC